MTPSDDPGAALRNIADQLPGLQGEVEGLREQAQKNRRMIRWLYAACAVVALVALAAVSWNAYQQAVIDSKSAAIEELADQNAAHAAAHARNDHDLCVKLGRSKALIVGVWAKVLSGRPDSAALLAQAKAAAEPLGKCPEAPPAGH